MNRVLHGYISSLDLKVIKGGSVLPRVDRRAAGLR